MDVDTALALVDPASRLQRRYMLVFATLSVPSALTVLNMEFAGHTPDTFECRSTVADSNGTAVLVNACFGGSAARCDAGIAFDSQYVSVVTDWQLVCDRAAAARTLQSLFMLGTLLSSLVVGPLADSLGRRRVGLVLSGAQAALIAAQAAAPDYASFAVLRLLAGASHSCTLPLYTLASELVRPDRRSQLGTVASVSFSAGLLVLAAAAYVTVSWRALMLLTAAIAAANVALMAALMPESPRWLLQRGRRRCAEQILLSVARNNGISPPADFRLAAAPVQKRRHVVGGDTCCSLLRRRRPAVWTITLCFNWAVHALSYYGLTAAAAAGLGGGRFWSLALSALVEVPPMLVLVWLLERLGRRVTLSGLMVVGGASSALIWLLPAGLVDEQGGRLTLSLVAKMCVSTSYTVTFLYSNEIFPTSLRSTGLGAANVCSRLAGVAYPFAVLLDSITRDGQFLLFGALVTVSALLNLGLPETRGRPLARTISEMELGGDAAAELYTGLTTSDCTNSDAEGSGSDHRRHGRLKSSVAAVT